MTRKGHLRVIYDEDFYRSMRRRIRDWAESKGKGHKYLEYILLAPDLLHLLAKLTLDSRVPRKSKAKLALAAAYFISPLDLLPEGLFGPVGFLDDIAVAVWAINGLIKSSGPEVVIDNWAGEGDILEIIERVISAANQFLGSAIVKRKKIPDK